MQRHVRRTGGLTTTPGQLHAWRSGIPILVREHTVHDERTNLDLTSVVEVARGARRSRIADR
jgi:hypothetical protein